MAASAADGRPFNDDHQPVQTATLLSVLGSTVSFPESAFIPLALGFFGLATGYLIYGPEELFKLPTRSRPVDLTTGIWGIWMPGFLQFLTGVFLFVGLAWFHSFREPTLYMTALAFTAYGVHWFAIGMARTLGGDPRPNGLMSVPFIFLSVLGIIVFFHAHDAPVGGLFIGLTLVYVSDFFASLFLRVPPVVGASAVESPPARPQPTAVSELGERALGFFHVGTGLWLIYLTFAATLNIASGMDLLI